MQISDCRLIDESLKFNLNLRSEIYNFVV